MAGAEERTGAELHHRGEARSVDDARQLLEGTRGRMTRDMEMIERRLRRVAEDMRDRLDLMQPARSRIRENVWSSLALAFAAGMAFAVITARRKDGRRSFAGDVLRSSLAQLPGAVMAGARAGIGDALRQEWRDSSPPRIGRRAANV